MTRKRKAKKKLGYPKRKLNLTPQQANAAIGDLLKMAGYMIGLFGAMAAWGQAEAVADPEIKKNTLAGGTAAVLKHGDAGYTDDEGLFVEPEKI